MKKIVGLFIFLAVINVAVPVFYSRVYSALPFEKAVFPPQKSQMKKRAKL